MNVEINSRKEIEKIIAEGKFPKNTAVISFCDSGINPRDRVNYSGVCERVMYIELDDLEFDELEEVGYTYETFFPEADEAAEFIFDAYYSELNIICQYECGKSLSAGCAAAIYKHFYHDGVSFFTNSQYSPNMAVYYKVLEELNIRGNRVELHAHTFMSQMEGVSSAEELITRAVGYNQTAIAISDNGVVQAFPAADLAAKEHNGAIKIIYGMEGSLSEFLPEHSTLVILAKNQTGLVNLYKLVSWSHLENMISDKPYITKDKLSKFREGLIIGSGSETGELFHAISDGKSDAELLEIARYYDYLEICPSMPKADILKIVQLGEKLNIPVCAAGLCPDNTYRMIEVFLYLGSKAYEVVVTNTNLIANMIDELRIIPRDIPMVIMDSVVDPYNDDTVIGVGKRRGTYFVFPNGYAPENFTPLQYADNSKDLVSHLDFSCFQDLKGQVSLPAIDTDNLGRLEKLTGIKTADIPTDAPAVYSLFTSPDALGLIDDRHDLFLRGTLSIANLANGDFDDIISICKPKDFEEVVKVCGLYYSDGGWSCNARNLVCSGTSELNEVISARDDIADHLVSRGVNPAAAIDIMEITSFGEAKTKLTPKHIQTMREHDVPEWYIESLKKFKFLFPKSVIAEYAKYIMELAWYKLYHPREYYKVYFESKRDLLTPKALDTIYGGADVIYKKICDLGEALGILRNESERMLLFETAYEAICRGVDPAEVI